MSEQSNRWSEVGERLEGLALKLKLHFEQTDRREEVPDALNKIRASVGEAFEAAGNAVRDEAVRADVREAGRLFVDAVSATFAKVSENLKDVAENMKDKPETTQATATAGPAASTEPIAGTEPAGTEPAAGTEAAGTEPAAGTEAAGAEAPKPADG